MRPEPEHASRGGFATVATSAAWLEREHGVQYGVVGMRIPARAQGQRPQFTTTTIQRGGPNSSEQGAALRR
jgi:hypothetical protein